MKKLCRIGSGTTALDWFFTFIALNDTLTFGKKKHKKMYLTVCPCMKKYQKINLTVAVLWKSRIPINEKLESQQMKNWNPNKWKTGIPINEKLESYKMAHFKVPYSRKRATLCLALFTLLCFLVKITGYIFSRMRLKKTFFSIFWAFFLLILSQGKFFCFVKKRFESNVCTSIT